MAIMPFVSPARTEELLNVTSLLRGEVALKVRGVLDVWARASKVTVARVKLPEGKLVRVPDEKSTCPAVLS